MRDAIANYRAATRARKRFPKPTSPAAASVASIGAIRAVCRTVA